MPRRRGNVTEGAKFHPAYLTSAEQTRAPHYVFTATKLRDMLEDREAFANHLVRVRSKQTDNVTPAFLIDCAYAHHQMLQFCLLKCSPHWDFICKRYIWQNQRGGPLWRVYYQYLTEPTCSTKLVKHDWCSIQSALERPGWEDWKDSDVILCKHLNYFRTKLMSSKIKGNNLLTRKCVSQTLLLIKILPELVWEALNLV